VSDPSETVIAMAGAIEETAKTTGKVIDATRAAGRWFEGKLGRSLDAAIGWAIEDPLIAGRMASQIRRRERLCILAHQTQARLSQMGVSTVFQPADKIIFPLLEAASLEDDPSLQELWAKLLARAVAGEDGIERVYISILADLTPVGALALRDYFMKTEDAMKPPYKEPAYRYSPGSLDGDLYGVGTSGLLFRLGLVEPASMIFDVVQDVVSGGSFGHSSEVEPLKNEIAVPGDLYRVWLTDLANDFCQAVGMESGNEHKPPQAGAANA
jgi:hypothetical protein